MVKKMILIIMIMMPMQ